MMPYTCEDCGHTGYDVERYIERVSDYAPIFGYQCKYPTACLKRREEAKRKTSTAASTK